MFPRNVYDSTTCLPPVRPHRLPTQRKTLSAQAHTMYGVNRRAVLDARRNRYVRGVDTDAKRPRKTTKRAGDQIDSGLHQKEFDIALSFAGEDREVVDVLAALLKERGVRVFYDKYEQAQLWGTDLYQHLRY